MDEKGLQLIQNIGDLDITRRSCRFLYIFTHLMAILRIFMIIYI